MNEYKSLFDKACYGDTAAMSTLVAQLEHDLVTVIYTNTQRDLHQMTAALDALQREKAERKIDPTARMFTTLDLVHRLVTALHKHRRADLATDLADREHCRNIIAILAEGETRANNTSTAVADLKSALRLSASNLSMQLAFLLERDAIARDRKGKTAYVALKGPGREYAIAQGWLTRPAIPLAESRFGRPPARTSRALVKPSQIVAEGSTR